MKLLVKDIIIGERQRIDLGDLSDLESIEDKEVGLIQPIVVHKTLHGYELVDGRRRLEKVTKLGWQEVEVVVKDLLTEVQKQKMELLADIGRKDRTWQEICVATYKVFNLIRRERMENHEEKWTIRAMALFTGISKSVVHESLEMAKFLLIVPRDEELWAAVQYYDACKILIQRTESNARAEEERRRQLAFKAKQEQPSLPTIDNSGLAVVTSQDPVLDNSPVRISDSTSQARKEVRVRIQGRNFAYGSQKPEDLGGIAQLVLIHGGLTGDIVNVLRADLRPTGFAIQWGNLETSIKDLAFMPFGLIWNTLKAHGSNWPFGYSYNIGKVFALKEPTTPFSEPTMSVISAPEEEDGTLPQPVVDFCLRTTTDKYLAVSLVGEINPVHIIEAGYIPVFFEPDPEKFKSKCLAVKAHYESTIPDVIVEMPEGF